MRTGTYSTVYSILLTATAIIGAVALSTLANTESVRVSQGAQQHQTPIAGDRGEQLESLPRVAVASPDLVVDVGAPSNGGVVTNMDIDSAEYKKYRTIDQRGLVTVPRTWEKISIPSPKDGEDRVVNISDLARSGTKLYVDARQAP